MRSSPFRTAFESLWRRSDFCQREECSRWWLHSVDDTSCWQWTLSEDASHNITAGRWEDTTHTHTQRKHANTVSHYDTVLKSHQGPYLDWLSSLTSLSNLISHTRRPLWAQSCLGPTHKMSFCFISGTVANAHMAVGPVLPVEIL